MSLPLLIAYGSFKGKGKNYAMTLGNQYGVDPIVMNDLPINQMLTCNIILFIVSTFGKGVFPQNAAAFFEKLKESKEDLSNLRFAVLGLGSSKHKFYDQAARDLFAELEAHHAKPLCQLYEVDARAADSGDSSFIRWQRELESHLPLPATAGQIVEKVKLTPITNYQYVQPVGFEVAHLVEATPLTTANATTVYKKYTFQLPANAQYSAGSHIDILPRNDDSVVSKVLSLLHLNESDQFEVQSEFESFLPKYVTIKELFSQYLDLNGLPTQFMINAFHTAASEEGKAKLGALRDVDRLTEYLKNTSVAQFIEEYAPYGIPSLNVLATAIPHIIPRTYSVATIPNANNHLGFVVHEIEFGNGRKGLASAFFSSLTPDIPVAFKLLPGVYQPADVPMIMIGIGAGVSPLFSIIEDRKQHNCKTPALLLFGTRHEDESKPMIELFEKEKTSGVLANALYAFSRDHGDKKYYIPHLMEDNKEAIWNIWKDPAAALYYCGPALGIPEQIKTILEQLVVDKLGIPPQDAAKIAKGHTWYIESF